MENRNGLCVDLRVAPATGRLLECGSLDRRSLSFPVSPFLRELWAALRQPSLEGRESLHPAKLCTLHRLPVSERGFLLGLLSDQNTPGGVEEVRLVLPGLAEEVGPLAPMALGRTPPLVTLVLRHAVTNGSAFCSVVASSLPDVMLPRLGARIEWLWRTVMRTLRGPLLGRGRELARVRTGDIGNKAEDVPPQN